MSFNVSRIFKIYLEGIRRTRKGNKRKFWINLFFLLRFKATKSMNDTLSRLRKKKWSKNEKF